MPRNDFIMLNELFNVLNEEAQKFKVKAGIHDSMFGFKNPITKIFWNLEENIYNLEIDLPGVKMDQIEVEVKEEDKKISIVYGKEGETKRFGNFTITAPKDADISTLAAELDLGVLKFTVEKETPKETSRKISIKTSSAE